MTKRISAIYADAMDIWMCITYSVGLAGVHLISGS